MTLHEFTQRHQLSPKCEATPVRKTTWSGTLKDWHKDLPESFLVVRQSPGSITALSLREYAIAHVDDGYVEVTAWPRYMGFKEACDELLGTAATKEMFHTCLGLLEEQERPEPSEDLEQLVLRKWALACQMDQVPTHLQYRLRRVIKAVAKSVGDTMRDTPRKG